MNFFSPLGLLGAPAPAVSDVAGAPVLGGALARLGGLDTGLMPGAPFGLAPMSVMGGVDPTMLLGGGMDPMAEQMAMLQQLLMGLMMGGGGYVGTDPLAALSSMPGMGGFGDAGRFGEAGGFGGGGGGAIGGGGGGGFSGGGGGGGGGSIASSPSSGSSGASGASGGSSYDGPPPDTGPVAPGTEAMLKKAGSMVGMTETGDTAAIQAITGKSGINPASTPWCAAFAINLMKDHGVLDTEGLSNPNYCPTIKSWANGKGIWGENGRYQPKPGDAILFDWQGDGTADHIGIVEKVENGKVYTIEGNSSDSVKRNVYNLGDSKIDGYVVSGKK